MTGIKLKVAMFDGTGDFGLWRVKAKSLLVHQSAVKETAAKDLWEALERKYMGKSLHNKLYCKQRLYLLQMQEGTSITSHINAFTKVMLGLENCGVENNDETQAILLLASLHPSLESFKDSMCYGKETISLSNVKEALKTKELKAKNEASTSENKDEGLVVRGRTLEKGNRCSKSRSKSRGKSRTYVYYGCGEKGHIKRNCPNRRQDQKQEQKSNNEKQAEASVVEVDDKWFATYNEVKCADVLMGDDHPCKVKGIGMVLLKMHDGVVRELTEVRQVSNMWKSLISLSALDTNGYTFSGGGGAMKVVKGSLVVMKGWKDKKFYVLQGSTVIGSTNVVSSLSNKDLTKLWHMSLELCEHCLYGKQTKASFNTRVHQSKEPLDYIHSDLWGPSKKMSVGRALYMLTCIDDHSRKVLVENHKGKKINSLRTDNGLEFCNQEFNEYYKNEGIARPRTVPRTPQQNGVVEHMNRTIMERVRWIQGLGPVIRRAFISHDVIFDENAILNPNVENGVIDAGADTKWGSKSKVKFQLGLESQKVSSSLLPPQAQVSHGYDRSMYDQCVYLRKLVDGTFIYLLLYVDDMLIIAKRKEDIDKLKKEMSSEFEMKDLGQAKRILGMEIHRDRHGGTIKLSQKKFVEKVLEHFNMRDAKPVSTLLASHFKLSTWLCPQSDEDLEYMSHVPYSSAVGSMMYAMVCTRPDISHAVSVVNMYMSNPVKEHWTIVKWILRYLKGTIGTCVEFKKDGTCTVALSTTEVEYMAMVEAFKEAIWLRELVGEFSLDCVAIDVHCDSQSAICLAEDYMFHERTKHIDVRIKGVFSGRVSLDVLGTPIGVWFE
ncbi:hypothetical protein SLEP1_g53526 [Rubroshorea leprosula]|uniref:Uncharacterized protein n=1 Tax=Rubroshorea leprosula TaxID=152421 RepID=A0AAV5M9N1_9ROSI|nr:hypothetical protein SLEP1_g53526 [Rubroshorea leprosula]